MTHTCHVRPHAAYTDLARDEILRLADSVRGADLGLAVPSCPGWTLGDLVDHVGGVHRWAATMVRDRSQERVKRSELDIGLGASGVADADWLTEGAAFVHTSFAAADPDASMWAWGSDPHARFWSRRMVHETAIHRADAELALGREFEIAADVAVDGIDELLDNLPTAAYFAPAVADLRGTGDALALAADDTGVAWRLELQPGGFDWNHEVTGAEQVTATGSAVDLLLMLYRRRAVEQTAIDVAGDESLLRFWLDRSAL